MKMTKDEAIKLSDLLLKKYPEFSREINESVGNYENNLQKLKHIQCCNHEWYELSDEEIKKIGTPAAFGIDNWEEKGIREFYMMLASYCTKCGMDYRYHHFKDSDFDKIIEKYEENPVIEIKISVKSTKSFMRKHYEGE